MCGIAVEIRNNKPQGSFINPMLTAIAHRGGDVTHIYEDDNLSVGFTRLSITEINHTSIVGAWKVFLNGEIYNYKELGLHGSEIEVLSQGFEKYGIDFVKQLNGMFAIVAVHDGNVYCFRDRYGIKPLYYYETSNVVLIASEIKAILAHPEYEFAVNENARRQWFVFNNILTNETLFEGVYKLQKGCVWSVMEDSFRIFWEWKFNPTPIDYEQAKCKVKLLVTQAIERQRPKETKYTSCLSGGIDSNIIASVLGDAKTFTVGFDGVLDERHQAKLTGTINETIIFNKVEHFEESIYHLEDLRVGACWSNYGLYKRIAKEPGKVCFDGAGADELFGGYTWRYTVGKNYYGIVNRTGVKDEYCEDLFKLVYKSDTLENRFLFDANYFLEGVLLSVDKMSMAHTTETRVPFLDNDLVDFCLTLPTEYKEGKQILKDAFKNELPEQIINSPKRGFSSPDWIKGEGNQALKWATASYNEWEKQFKNK